MTNESDFSKSDSNGLILISIEAGSICNQNE